MADEEESKHQLHSIITKGVEQAFGVMTSYLDLLEKSMPDALSDGAEVKILKHFIARQVTASLELSEKMSDAKEFEDLVRIQTEFLQSQAKQFVESVRRTAEVKHDEKNVVGAKMIKETTIAPLNIHDIPIW